VGLAMLFVKRSWCSSLLLRDRHRY